MKRGLKWFLGIVIGLVVVAVLVVGGFLVFNRWHVNGRLVSDRDNRLKAFGQGMPWSNVPGQREPNNFGPQYQRPMRSMWGAPMARFGGFRPLRLLFGCLITIGFLVLVVSGIIYLVRPRRPVVTPVAAAPPAPAPDPTAIHACPHCGRQVQDDWSHCPYCGGPLTGQAESTTPLN